MNIINVFIIDKNLSLDPSSKRLSENNDLKKYYYILKINNITIFYYKNIIKLLNFIKIIWYKVIFI